MVAHARILRRIKLIKIMYDTGKLRSKFGEHRSLNSVTILSTDAGRTDGRTDGWTFAWFYILSNAMHRIGQTTGMHIAIIWDWQKVPLFSAKLHKPARQTTLQTTLSCRQHHRALVEWLPGDVSRDWHAGAPFQSLRTSSIHPSDETAWDEGGWPRVTGIASRPVISQSDGTGPSDVADAASPPG